MNTSGTGNPLGLGLVVVGAVAMALGAFLPLNEPTTAFRMVSNNTLIQHGGWMLIACAVGIAAGGVWASQHNSYRWGVPVSLCVLAALGLVFWATDKGFRTLYPIGADGAPDTSQPGVTAQLGIAIYVAGAGVAVALVGSLMLRHSGHAVGAAAVEGGASAGAPTKKCPDCAETILADAKVCKHCGYRFDAAAPPAPQARQVAADEPSTKVTCANCQREQYVPQSQRSFTCAQCHTSLRRTKLTVRCPLCDAEQKIPASAARFTCGRCREVSDAPA